MLLCLDCFWSPSGPANSGASELSWSNFCEHGAIIPLKRSRRAWENLKRKEESVPSFCLLLNRCNLPNSIARCFLLLKAPWTPFFWHANISRSLKVRLCSMNFGALSVLLFPGGHKMNCCSKAWASLCPGHPLVRGMEKSTTTLLPAGRDFLDTSLA